MPLPQPEKPPVGKVTFLCTDIANAESLTEALGALRFRQNLFDSLAERVATLRGNGVPFSGPESCCCLAYDSARDALEAAERLAKDFDASPHQYRDRDAGRTYSASIRIALCTASEEIEPTFTMTAITQGWRYSAASVAPAVAILKIGNEGQVLMASSTREKARKTNDRRLHPWDAREIETCEMATDVWELLWDKESKGEPGRRFLPDPYFGRDSVYVFRREIEQSVRDALFQKTVRQVTLVGGAGTGKSRLAYECLLTLRSEFQYGAAMVRLEDFCPDLYSVKDAICEGLGWKASAYTPESLRDDLQKRSLLILLDSYEGVDSDEVRDYLASFLPHDSPLRFLVTTRTTSVPHYEWEYRLSLDSGMTDAEANALMGAGPDEHQGEILRVTKKNPLALELCAAWFSPPERLGTASSLPADSGLNAVIGWAYRSLQDKLKDGELTQIFFTANLFSSGFALNELVEITRLSPERIERLLGQLSDFSFLRTSTKEASTKYRMPRAIQSFVQSTLNEIADAKLFRDNFFHYWYKWSDVFREMSTEEQKVVFSREWRNYLFAIESAIEREEWNIAYWISYMGSVWLVTDLYSVAERLTRYAFTAAKSLETAFSTGKAFYDLAALYDKTGRTEEAANYLRKAIQVSEGLDDDFYKIRSVYCLGINYRVQERYAESLPLLEQALKSYRAKEDRFWEGYSLTNLGQSYHALKRYPEAAASFEQATACLSEASENKDSMLGWIFETLGAIYGILGEDQKVYAAYDKALEISTRLELPEVKSRIQANIALFEAKQGRYQIAWRLAREAVTTAKTMEGAASGEAPTFAQKTLDYLNDPRTRFHLTIANRRWWKNCFRVSVREDCF